MRSSTGSLVAICVAFAVTAFLGGMAASIVLGGDDNDSGGGGAVVSQPTQAAVNRTPATGQPATGSPAAVGTTAPVVAPTQPPAAAATAAQPTAAAAAATYTVVSGDTLTGIAIKQNIPVDRRTDWIQQVRTLNSLTGDNIQIGQVLRLPPATAGAPTTPAAASPAATTVAGTPRPTTPAGTAPAATATRAP
ncbi:MAG TPA: LysM peptidoglycan-binding domain-containing protein [Dehalococcoidia bacterium]|nr:LysM peptidoglycan-binding domain-containing protein [Dehalococcoidia bacterium]